MAVAVSERGIYHKIPPDQNGRKPLYYESLIGLDILQLRASPVFNGEGVPRGDRSSVIVVPGYGSNDLHTKVLRDWLEKIEYITRPSGISVVNFDPEFFEEQVAEKVDEEFRHSSNRVHLIGHSLGGIMVRTIAARRPEKVKSVTTMGSPLYGEPEEVVDPLVLIPAKLSMPLLRNRERLNRRKKEISQSLHHKGVRVTSIYTKGDGVVDWRYCVDPDPNAENIEVPGCHMGLIFNHEVYGHLGRVLAKPQLAEITEFPSRSRPAA